MHLSIAHINKFTLGQLSRRGLRLDCINPPPSDVSLDPPLNWIINVNANQHNFVTDLINIMTGEKPVQRIQECILGHFVKLTHSNTNFQSQMCTLKSYISSSHLGGLTIT